MATSAETVAAVMDEDIRRRPRLPDNTADMWSAWAAVLLSLAALVFFFWMPEWQPKENGVLYKFLSPWFALLYLRPQMWLLARSLKFSQEVSVADMIAGLSPAGVGAIILAINVYKWYDLKYAGGQGRLLSLESINLVFVMIATAVLDSLITIKVKLEMKGRTITSA